ncbi:MAG: Rieske 2Fe-2S domain-containing protein [Caulobacteraceae bacterium]
MSARPEPGHLLCRLDKIGDPGALGFVFGEGDDRFAGFVVRQGEAVRGYVDSCPHVGLPLALTATGYLTRRGDYIMCSTHGALFQPADGLCVGGPCAGRSLRPWPVEVAGEEVRTL